MLIRYKILDYAPDLIVLVVDMTDDFDDWKYRQTALYDADGNPKAVPPRNAYLSEYVDTESGPVEATFWTRAQLFLYRHSYFYAYLLSRREPTTGSRRQPVADAYPRWAWCLSLIHISEPTRPTTKSRMPSSA